MNTNPDFTQQQQQQQASGQSQTPALTPEQLAAIVAQSVQQSLPQAPPQQLTQEQYDQMFATYRPNNDLVNALFGETATPESRLAALSQLVDGITRMAGHHALYLADGRVQEFGQTIAEPLEAARYLDNQRFFEELYKDHDGLKSFDPMIRGTLNAITGAPNYPRERDKRVAFVRDHYTNMLKQHDPNFDPRGARQQQQQPGQYPGGFAPQSPQQGFPQQQQPQQQYRPQQQAGSLPSFSGGSQGAAQGHSSAGGVPSVREATGGHGF